MLDMKLGGSGSELDDLGDVVVSSFLTRMDQLLRQMLWRFIWLFGVSERFLRYSRVEQSSRCNDSVDLRNDRAQHLLEQLSAMFAPNRTEIGQE
jgi:hypothetical protein